MTESELYASEIVKLHRERENDTEAARWDLLQALENGEDYARLLSSACHIIGDLIGRPAFATEADKQIHLRGGYVDGDTRILQEEYDRLCEQGRRVKESMHLAEDKGDLDTARRLEKYIDRLRAQVRTVQAMLQSNASEN